MRRNKLQSALMLGSSRTRDASCNSTNNQDNYCIKEEEERDKRKVCFVAIRRIEAGEEVCISYVGSKLSSDERAIKLWKCWYFQCDCVSCLDRSEQEGYEI